MAKSTQVRTSDGHRSASVPLLSWCRQCQGWHAWVVR
jgi:hypothetical protein